MTLRLTANVFKTPNQFGRFMTQFAPFCSCHKLLVYYDII